MKTQFIDKALIIGLCVAIVSVSLSFSVVQADPHFPFDRYERHAPRHHFGPAKPGPLPRGRWHAGIGIFSRDTDAFKWLAFTAITLKVLDNLNEEQQRAHETAQLKAAEADVGETIYWNKDGASGSVTVTRDGNSSSGRYCREFQHKIIVGGKEESAYGTACRNPDGSWEVVSKN